MPYLPNRKIDTKPTPKPKPRDNTQQVYAKQRWRKLRALYLAEHPLCEFCEKIGIAKGAEDVHHKDGFDNYSGDERAEKAFDYTNLVALCKEHHAFLHRNGRTHGLSWDRELKAWQEYVAEKNKIKQFQ